MNDQDRVDVKLNRGEGPQQRPLFSCDEVLAVRISAIYLMVSSLWIFGSGTLLQSLAIPESHKDSVELLKGLLFVTVTTGLIFVLLCRQLSRQSKSEKRFKALTANAADLILLLDCNGIIQYASTAAERMFGLQPEESIGKSFALWVHPDDLSMVKASLENRIQQGGTSSRTLTVRGKHADGSWRVLEALGTNLMDDPAVRGIVLNIRDITERTNTTDRIRQLSNAVEHSAASVVITNTQGEIEYVNSAFCRVTGYSLDEVLGQNPRLLKSGYTQPHEYRHMWETISAGKEWHGEFNNRKKNGEMYWESASISPVLDEQGKAVSFVAVKEDITERKIIERALEESERRFRALIEHSVDGVVLINVHGIIKYAAPSLTSLLGYHVDEYVETPAMQYVHPDDEAMASKLLRRLMKAGQREIHVRGRHRHRDGSWRWLEGVATNQLDNPSVRSIVFNFRDFTARRDAEVALRDALEYADKIVSASPVGILTYRSSGECISCNEAASVIVGGSIDELLQQNFRELDSWKSTGLLDIAERALRGESPKPAEIKLVSSFGKEAWVSARFTVFSIVGEKHLLLNIADFTERKQLNEQLRQSQKLESIGTLSGGIAHDFNNVLGILMAYLTVAGRETTTPQRRADAVETMMTAVKRGAALVRQLLTFARRTESTKIPFDLNVLIKELQPMLRATIPPMIEIRVETDGQLPPVVGDQSQLHQALLNLCVNARDALPRGGIIHIVSAQAPAKSMPEKFHPLTSTLYAKLSVSDNGHGMPEEVQKRVFEPFFTTKGIGKGTGLGLAVLYGVVKAHEGFVDLQSAEGVGTTFTLYLPLPNGHDSSPPPREGTPVNEISRGEGTILLVEDEKILSSLVRDSLTSVGYRVHCAFDGEDALKKFSANAAEIDLVVCDIGLPKLSGVEVVRRMRAVNEHLRVVMVSGSVDESMKRELQALRITKVLSKPYDPADLLRRVSEELAVA